MAGQDTLADWTPTILTKFIRDLFQNQPPDFLPNLNAENVTAHTNLTIRDKVTLTKEPSWRLVGGTGQPAFENSWTNYGSGWVAAGFWRDPLGWVHLRGLIKSGTINTAAFTLPPGFRPATGAETFAVNSNGAFGTVQVGTDGVVTPTVGNNTYVSLAGIHFRTS